MFFLSGPPARGSVLQISSPEVSNCLIFALAMYFRCGGYILIRKSRHGWWWHFLWTRDFRAIYEYAPAKKHDRLFPPLLFRGTVKRRSADELP